MAGWVKSLWQDSIVYGIGYGISRFLQIIILPIMAQALTVSEFGYYSNYVIFYTFSAGLFVMGLDSAVARYFYESDDKKYHQKLFSTAFYFMLGVSVTGVIVISMFPGVILSAMGIPPTYISALPYVLATIPVMALNNLFLTWFKWNRKKIYFLMNSGGSVVLLLVPLLLASNITFKYIFQVLFLGQLTVLIISAIPARHNFGFIFDRKLLGTLLVYGFPWLLVFLFGVSRTYLDRVFLTQYLTGDAYGVYNFSVRISTILSLVITAFDMSFGPLAFSIWNKEGAAPFFAKLQSMYLLLISVLACAICIVAPLLILLLGGENYAGSVYVLPLLLFAAIPVSLVNFSNLGTTYAKKSFLSTLSLFIGFAAVLILNILFTHIYLQYGAAGASLLGQMLIVVTGYFFSRKYYKIPFAFAKDACIYFLFMALSFLVVYFPLSANMYLNMLLQASALALLTVLLIIFIFPVELRRGVAGVRGIIFGSNENKDGGGVVRY